LWPGCVLPKIEDTLDVQEEVLAGMGLPELLSLALELNVVTNDVDVNSEEKLRELLSKQKLDL